MKNNLQNLMLTRFRDYWALIKSSQTGLLLLTGLAGYSSARCPVTTWKTQIALFGSLFLAISGSTVLNMWFDRDIDAVMCRTANRPLPTGRVSPRRALTLGLVLSTLGVGWALIIAPLYGTIVLAGFFFNVVVYTIFLKRRTAWSIVWGGIAGGMPVLAGRILGTDQIDLIGILLSLVMLLWIPTHIMTFSMRYKEEYQKAGIPTFPSMYGFKTTRWIISLSSLGLAAAMVGAAIGFGMAWGYLRLLGVLTTGLVVYTIFCLVRPSSRVNFGLFKFASVFMLSSMILVLVDGL